MNTGPLDIQNPDTLASRLESLLVLIKSSLLMLAIGSGTPSANNITRAESVRSPVAAPCDFTDCAQEPSRAKRFVLCYSTRLSSNRRALLRDIAV